MAVEGGRWIQGRLLVFCDFAWLQLDDLELETRMSCTTTSTSPSLSQLFPNSSNWKTPRRLPSRPPATTTTPAAVPPWTPRTTPAPSRMSSIVFQRPRWPSEGRTATAVLSTVSQTPQTPSETPHNHNSPAFPTATRPASAPELATTTTATSNDASLHLRRSLKSEENKENDKENDNRSSAQATQAVIQRRRRPKRRSTGVVHVDMEVRGGGMVFELDSWD